MNDHYPSSLRCLYTGLNTPTKSISNYLRKPDWVDDEKVRAGQEFALKHFFGIEYAQMLSLMILFSFDANTKPLIFTRKSHTVERAARRYISTAQRVLTWYDCDLWDENGAAQENFLYVRFIHDQISQAMNMTPRADVLNAATLRASLGPDQIQRQSLSSLKRDFKGHLPSYIQMIGNSPIFINQAEMSFTLFGFMGLALLYPEYFGIHGATNEELEAFVHLWRVIGHQLGIIDDFNMCAGSLEEVKFRCQEIVQRLFVPNLVSLNEEWEHLSRCMISGIKTVVGGPPFETSLLYLFWLIGIDAPRFRLSVSTPAYLLFHLNKFLFYVLIRIPFIRDRFNYQIEQKLKNYSR